MTVIFSAKAGPVKANAAPSASVASVVLVFDMVLSLWTPVDGAISKQRVFDLIPAQGVIGEKFSSDAGLKRLAY
jgi:hypothetical protein